MRRIFNIRTFDIYKSGVKTSLAGVMTYRFDFILSMIITLLSNILFPLVTILIYTSGASFPGWDFYEVLLIQAIFTISNGVSGIMFGGLLWSTMGHVREGSFEIVLLKPVNPLFFLVLSTFSPDSISLILGGAVMMWFALSHTGIASAFAIVQFVLLFFAGLSVMAGMSVIMAAASFKWVGNSRLPEIFDSIKNFGKYPISVFPKLAQSFVTFIIPVGMIGFFPASAILGRLDPKLTIAVIPCALFMMFSIWLYNYMIRLYESVGG